MLKKTVSWIILLLLLGLFTLTFNVKPAWAWSGGTIYIRADGRIDPPNAPIKTLDYETYTLIDSIISFADGIIVERDNVIVDGADYALLGLEGGKGIYLFGRSNVTIKKINIRNFFYGVYLNESTNCSIVDNDMKYTMYGYYGCGIYLYHSFNNIISGNEITGNNYGIIIDHSSNNIIFGNSITDSGDGICLYSSSYNNIFANNIKEVHRDVLRVYDSSYNTISANILTYNYNGIVFYNSSDNTISANNITNNEFTGIDLSDSSNDNRIFGNNITNNGRWGISLYDSSYNKIFANNLEKNLEAGIFICRSSHNSIFQNRIANAHIGIDFHDSSSNILYHNNFISNLKQVNVTVMHVNSWDNGYPAGGNYWSDYTSVDLYSGAYQNETGSDGIGDTHYFIDANNVDRYPLINPWSPIPVKVFDIVWVNIHYSVSSESNSSITHFVFNQSLAQISFKLTGYAGETGYCNITIPKNLMKGPWDYIFEGNVLDVEIFEGENITHSFISFTYKHASTFKVTIQAAWVIPEFRPTMILPLFMIVTLAVVVLQRQHSKHYRNSKQQKIYPQTTFSIGTVSLLKGDENGRENSFWDNASVDAVWLICSSV